MLIFNYSLFILFPDVWMSSNASSPRTEVVHQVVNKYNTLTNTSQFCNYTSGPCSNAPFGQCRVP